MVAVAARYTFSFFIAATIVFGLFWMMQSLITTADHKLNKAAEVHPVNFVRLKQSEQSHHQEQKPEKPPLSMQNARPEARSMAVSAWPVQHKIALNAAKSDKRRRKSAERWLAYMGNEQARQEQLRKNLKHHQH